MKWNKKHVVLSVFLPIQVLFTQLSASNPEWIEQYYSRGIYIYISSFLRTIFGWIPYSVGDVLILFLLLYLLNFVYRLLRSKFKKTVSLTLELTAILSVVYFCFYFFWGLNYYRVPLENNLRFQQKKYSSEQLIKTTRFVANELNKIHFSITNNDTLVVKSPYTRKEIYKLSVHGFKEVEKLFPLLKYRFPSVKSSSMSLLQSYNGTSGYLNPLTGEAHVNSRIPKTGYPTTTCHEIAHQIGFAAENEANFIGFLAANYNDNPYFKYASYRMAFSYCIAEVRKRNPKISKEIWSTLHKGILEDYSNSYTFWNSYKNPIEPLVKKGYNSYLKANNQKAGIASYNYVVDLLISFLSKEINSSHS